MTELPTPRLLDFEQLADEIETATGQRLQTLAVEGGTLVVNPYEPDDFQAVLDVIHSHRPARMDDLDQLVTKAQAVWQGTDTFTAAQSQKILAGLVLVVARWLR